MKLELTWEDRTLPYHLADGEHTVGRAGDNLVRIPMGRVSKFHAVVRVDGDRLFVRDLGSTNGTEVAGDRIGREDAWTVPVKWLELEFQSEDSIEFETEWMSEEEIGKVRSAWRAESLDGGKRVVS